MRKTPYLNSAYAPPTRLTRRLLTGVFLATIVPACPATASGVLTEYLVGHVAASMGDYATAVQNFDAVLARDPHNIHALNEDFEVLALSGGQDTLRIAKQLPRNPLAIMEVANAEAATGRWDQAAATYARLPESGPFALMRPVLAAWCDAGAGRNLAAIHELQAASAPAAPPLSGLYLLHAAMIADIAGRVEDATALYRSAQDQTSQANLRFVLAEASFLARSGQLNTARGMLTDLLSNVPQDRMALPRLEADVTNPLVSTAQQGLAEFYQAIGGILDGGQSGPQNNEQSVELSRVFLQMAVDLRPDLTEARLTAAAEDQQSGRYAQALAMLAPVKTDDALDPLVRLARGTILDDLGETDQALALLNQLAADYPLFVEPYEVTGDIDRAHGRSSDAVAAYDRAVQRRGSLGAQDWILLFDRAVAFQNDGNWPAAESDLQAALKLSPNEPDLMNFLGYTWADQNRNLPQARDLLERAVKLEPQNGAIIDSLGWVKFRQGDVADAVSTLETAVQLLPEDPDVNTHLGYAYEAAGRRLEARYQWQYALTLNPTSEEAAQLRAKLASVEVLSAAKPVGLETRNY